MTKSLTILAVYSTFFALLISVLPASSAPISAPAASASAVVTRPSPMRIIIDPGHGGSDTGAARGSLKESEIALKVSLELATFLRKDPRFVTSLTRSSDQRVSLARRTEIAEQAKADLFISIHLNSSPDPRAHGTEIYFQNQLPADEEALFLVSRENEALDSETHEQASVGEAAGTGSESLSARQDLKRILEDLKRNYRIEQSSELGKTLLQTLIANNTSIKFGNRSIRQAPFWVVSATKVPAVLVELGFITHSQEGQRLAESDYQLELAHSLYEGIVKFKETMDNSLREPVD
jgi:N-acetylmuramoyl-L-alanine amidase